MKSKKTSKKVTKVKKVVKARKPIKAKKLQGSIKETTVFMNGQSQSVRIPKEFRLAGKKVYIKKSGNCIILIPADDPWRNLLDAVGQFSDDFMENGREQPPQQEREEMFP